MKRLLDFLGAILCGLAALVGLLAGGVVLIVYSLFSVPHTCPGGQCQGHSCCE